MARRKRSSGSSASGLSSRFANPALMAKLFQQMAGSAREPSQKKKDLTPEELLEEWVDAVDAMCESHDDSVIARAKKLKATLSFTSIDRNTGVECTVQAGGQSFQCQFSLDLRKRDFDCNCSCDDPFSCEHTYVMALKLEAMLEDSASILSKAILGENPSERSFNKTLALLQSLTRNAQLEKTIESDGVIEEKPLTRYVWNFSQDDDYSSCSLFPCIQQEKKGGWTKGKESTIEAFLRSPRTNWSSLDHQLADLVRQERWHAPSIEVAEGLRVLAGSDQFMIEREPCMLSMRPLEILVIEEANGEVRLSTNAGEYISLTAAQSGVAMMDVSRGILVYADERKEAVFFRGPLHSYEICRQLFNESAPVPKEKLPALLQQLDPLRSCMAVRLPESVAGKEIIAEAQPVLTLQLRRNGTLDATMQIRDRNQMLHAPGEGLARLHDNVNGEPVQFVRDLAAEVRNAQDLAAKLKVNRGVPLSRWSWRLADGDDISNLLTDAGSAVERAELVVLWHKDSVSRFDVIGRLTANNVRVEVTRQRDWFGLSGTCQIGDQEISLKEILAGMHGRPMNGLMEISPGKWATVAAELRDALKRLSDVSQENRGKLQLDASAAPIVNVLEAAKIQIEADKHWEKCLKRLRDAEDAIQDPPAGLNAELRDYQLEGFRWLCRLSQWGVGGILADDMGLGKTVQTLALLLTRVESGPTLVIAPTSLGFNWQRECERFTPSLTPILFRDIDRIDLKNKVGEGDLVICSYGLALREAELLKEIKWGTLILDEAQNIKNSNSKTAAQIRTFEADWKIALTGTPMENHLGELWSIFHTVAPGVLGSWEQFRRRFAAPIEKESNSDRRQALSQVIAPFILRRSKRDVLKDLPARTETNLMVDLSADERLRYDQMRLAAVTELDQIGDENLSHDQRFKVLQMLTRLRQLSCHIGLVDDKWKGSSAKLDVLMEQFEQLKEQGNRPLIFSQFTTHLALIRAALEKAGFSYQYLDGQTTPAQRQERVEAFQRGESDVFLISLKAGGTGLNLTAADYVIHMDPWWNPAVEDQATDRAHRIGQTKPVMVYRIIARGTIEEQILQMHDEKRDLVDGVLSGADAAGKLSTKELADMIRQGIEVPGRR